MKRISYRSFFILFCISFVALVAGAVYCVLSLRELLKNYATADVQWPLVACGILCALAIGALIFFVWLLYRMGQERLYRTAYVDPLTGSHNFHSMYTRFEEHLTALNGKAALVVLNVVKFKVINDLHGYQRGNEVLQQVAQVLKHFVAENETFCRMSADNFLLLLSFENKNDFAQRMMKLITQLRRECSAEETRLMIDVALGIYELPTPAVPFYIALDRAHFALEKAKTLSLHKYQFFAEEDRSRVVAEQQMENTMHQALSNREFEVYLQPKCDFKTGHLRGAEALVRWNKTDGIVRPDEFIPVFEKNGFILQLDMFIFEEVAHLLQQWQEKGLSLVPIAVNFSRLHLNDDRFVPQMRRVASSYNVATHLLEVELTESVIFNNLQRAQSVLNNLHRYGFSVAMDDFGAGYSSLNVLKNLHFDSIKLDKEFLGGFQDNPYAQNVIEGTVKMIKKLNVQVVAEGVETREQVDFLKQIGCDIAQGYFFSRPLKADAFEQALKENIPLGK